MSKILIVDDERKMLAAFKAILAPSEHVVSTVERAEAALQQIEAEEFDLVILDICMPGMGGLEAMQRIRQRCPRLPVIVMTGRGTMETAIEATKRGAFEYQLKPFEPAEMLAIIERALESARIMKGHVAVDPEQVAITNDALIGQTASMQEVYKAIGRVAATDATVLIRGESGTGKELIARAIYHHSSRSDKPLLAVNCAAIPETLLEGELFGHERGAFTGAQGRRIGKFEQADGGTLFLDEIGDIPLTTQIKILRVLQERCFERLGGNETVGVDVRVLAATNANLEKAIEEGKFRSDLYHRLNVVTIDVPPLRERRDDIPRLVDYFLERYARELKIDKPPLATEAMDLLTRYFWPGNVRELEHCIHRAMIFTHGYPIQASDLPLGRSAACSIPDRGGFDDRLLALVQYYLGWYEGPRPHEHLMEQAEKLLLQEALRQTHGHQTHASQLLGLPRATLHTKLQKYGLNEVEQ
jgi:nitrogen regulation protein NR(I)